MAESTYLNKNNGEAGPKARKIILPTDWTMNERQLCDLEMIFNGAYAPLNGFMSSNDYKSVVDNLLLANGAVFSLPVVLAIPKDCCGDNATTNVFWMKSSGQHEAEQGKTIRLRDNVGCIVAELNVEDVYEPDLIMEMDKVLGTRDENHPYVQYLKQHNSNCYYVGGPVVPVEPIRHFDYKSYRISPAESRAQIEANGYKVVVGFQTRNPLHRCHYELIKKALQTASEEQGTEAVLFLSPVVGPTQPGDVPYHIRARCYQHLLEYFQNDKESIIGGSATVASTPRDAERDSLKVDSQDSKKCILAFLPFSMRMAGPRECVLHALIRKNYGCTHFIVGRDHAGPSTRKADGSPFYGPYDAHKLLKQYSDKIGIKPIFGFEMVHVDGKYISLESSEKINKTQPPAKIDSLSGTEFRSRLMNREEIPSWFSFPKVVKELQAFYKPHHQRGLCIYFTGLPCSGKSTLANALDALLLENKHETRRVTVLDADVVRQHLSAGLGFSKEDRSTNVRRIGYISSEICKHGGICLVANIAPYKEDRSFNRRLIEKQGGIYVEVHVSTPLAVCEERDIKELYKKARMGIIKQFTGISDPYEEPNDAEITIDSSDNINSKVMLLMDYLKEKGYVVKSAP